MAKDKLDGLTKEQLKAKEQQLQNEIETLTNVIKASNTTVLDLLIGEVKKEMQDNIAEENWKILKENQKKIEAYRSIEKTLQNQEELLEDKRDELEDVQYAIDNYQPSLFEQQKEIDIDGQCESTGFKTNEFEIETGDVYKNENEDGKTAFYLVKKSIEKDDCFSIISNAFNDELLLNYPKNRELIESSDYIGNIFLSEAEQSAEELQNALNALKVINESVNKTEDEQPSESN